MVPKPVSNSDVYLVEIINKLDVLHTVLGTVVDELQRLNTVATQKPTIQLDATKIANAINAQMPNTVKSNKTKV